MGLFWQLGDSSEGVQSRRGLLYIDVSMEFYILMIILIERYCGELKVFDRELQDDMYEPSAYLTSHIIASLPSLLIQPILYSIPIYFGCNLRAGGTHFFELLIVNILMSFIVNGITWMCISIHREFSVASLIANTNFTFLSLTAGYLVNLHDIPSYISWFKYISFCGYGYKILMYNEFDDNVYGDCDASNPDDNCLLYDGSYILSQQGIDRNDYINSWPALIALCIGYHLIAYILLDVIRHPVTGIVGSDISSSSTSSSSYETDYIDVERVVVGKQDSIITTPTLSTNASSSQSHDEGGMIITDDDHDDDDDVVVENNNNDLMDDVNNCKDEVPVDHVGTRQKVAIRIVNISLFVQVKATWRQNNLPTIIPATDSINSDADSIGNNNDMTISSKMNNNHNTRSKMILSHVSATIDSGRLVALMGGSGSGKTTLLNLLAGRIQPASKDPDKSPRSHLFFRSLLSSQYTGDGQILFNGRVPTGSERRELVGYGINIIH